MQQQGNPNIVVTGEVPDVRPYLATADAMVVPLRQGSGTRFKILEAFSAGCPVVSTAKGAEGLNANNEEHLLLRERPEDLVEAIEQLKSSAILVQGLTQRAYEQVTAHYSWTAVERIVANAIGQLTPALAPI
jgi:glycosyltransferase involved in cell wall biosynthesis